jgi:hypothetical protein
VTNPPTNPQHGELQSALPAALPAARMLPVEENGENSSTVLPLEKPPIEAPPKPVLPVGSVPRAATLASQLSTIEPFEPAEKALWRYYFNVPNLVSMVLHAWVLLALALWAIAERPLSLAPTLTVSLESETGEPEVEILETKPLPIKQLETSFEAEGSPLVVEESLEVSLATGAQQLSDPGPAVQRPLTAGTLLMPLGESGGGLEGRSETARGRLVNSRGGSAASEQAVSRGLRWLMAHQLNDGSWRLNLELCPECKGACSHSGNVGSTTAATALALLPFLGVGSTHEQGEYNEVVSRGLYYLTSRMQLDRRGGDLQEGTMYAQGLSTLVLCEAYALSHDENLKDYAQEAVKFIEQAQHKEGGWRYLPGQPGDTTSLGWQLMALKSARRAGLDVSPAAFYGAAHFLDTVATDGGSGYGYQSPERTDTMSAIGLLSRMYLGWPREHAALQRGVAQLAEHGPSAESMYFNYYATQVMFHNEGPEWETWNNSLRDYLIEQQATEGHESGSWYFEDSHTETAGRLYHTAMAIMILEVYYRYLPLYGIEMVEGEGIAFPVE